jgi:HNH endonuclease
MKICWDNLENIRYNNKTCKFYKGNNCYIEMDSCKICGESYLTRYDKIGDFCSNECRIENRKIKKDITGKRFGRLVVIKKTNKKKYGSYVWKCLCDCGNIKEVKRNDLISGATKSCGCLQKEKASESHKLNLIGKRFGRLVVLEDTGKKPKKSRNTIWKCICDCGNISEIRGDYLTNETTKSCGCYKIDKSIKKLKGKKFGKLIVIKKTNKRKYGNVVWLCKCSCGNEKEILSRNLINGSTKSCGCFHKERIKEANSGEKNTNWKGGVSENDIPLYDTYAHKIEYAEEVRRSIEDKNILEVKCTYCDKWYIPKATEVQHRINSLNDKQQGESRFYCSDECKNLCTIFGKQIYQENHPNKPKRLNHNNWAKIIKEKFNYTCEICGSKDNLEAHHILPVKTNPELENDINNGACLCHDCHMKHGHKDECSLSNLAKVI